MGVTHVNRPKWNSVKVSVTAHVQLSYFTLVWTKWNLHVIAIKVKIFIVVKTWKFNTDWKTYPKGKFFWKPTFFYRKEINDLLIRLKYRFLSFEYQNTYLSSKVNLFIHISCQDIAIFPGTTDFNKRVRHLSKGFTRPITDYVWYWF